MHNNITRLERKMPRNSDDISISGNSINSTKSAKEVRQTVRDYIRNERDTVLIKWRCLDESVKSEDRYREMFLHRRAREDTKTLPVNIQKFIGTLKKAVRKTMLDKGGTPFSIIRALFMYWTSSTDGTLTSNDLKNCMNSLGVKMTDQERAEVVAYYDAGKGAASQEMSYHELLQDVTHGEPTAIQLPPDHYYEGDVALRYEEVADEYAVKPPVIQEFIEATRNYIMTVMRNEGGTPYYHVRYLFQFFDYDLSNGLSPQELQTAAKKKMKLAMTTDQAEQIVRYYDRRKEGQMQYEEFLKDVQAGELSRPILSFKELTPGEIETAKSQLAKNAFMPRPFKAAANRVLENLKLLLKRALIKRIGLAGGRFESWLLAAFREYDKSLSNKISNWEQIRDLIHKVGVHCQQSEILMLIKSYDKHNTGEMHYLDFIRDMDAEDHCFLAGGSVALNPPLDSATSRCPSSVTKVIARFKRAVDIHAAKSSHAVSSRDLLHGTFLRFDSGRHGHLSTAQVEAVAKELAVPIMLDEIGDLLAWFDSRGTGFTMDYNEFTRQVYGSDDVLTKKITLPKLSKKAGSAAYNYSVTYAMPGAVGYGDVGENVALGPSGNFGVVTSGPRMVSNGSDKAAYEAANEIIENTKAKAARLMAKRSLVLNEREAIVSKLAMVDAAKKKLMAEHSQRRAREAAAKAKEDSVVFMQNLAVQQQLRKEARESQMTKK